MFKLIDDGRLATSENQPSLLLNFLLFNKNDIKLVTISAGVNASNNYVAKMNESNEAFVNRVFHALLNNLENSTVEHRYNTRSDIGIGYLTNITTSKHQKQTIAKRRVIFNMCYNEYCKYVRIIAKEASTRVSSYIE